MIGVSILVQGTTVGTVTDFDGHFYLAVPDKQSVLEISYMGYKSQQIKVGNDIAFNITMYEDAEALDEVVVVGYGNQKKLSVIGSIQAVEPKNLQVGASRSMSNNLAGQLAGVIAVQPSGETGYDNSNFWIRGIASFSGSTSPLVLVDGVERSLNDIDPAEIEAFSVLKDASASAMYGVRGANGVILINTKRGTVAPPSISMRVEQAFSTPTKLPQFIGAAEYMDLLNHLCSDPTKRLFTKDQILKTYNGYDKDLYPDVNWMDAITNDWAHNTRVNLNVAGGSERLRYALTASYYNEKGIMATAFGTLWPVAFMGIIFAQQTYKKVDEFKAMEGEVYNCAKIGWILARVGKYFGIGLTVFFVIWATMMAISLIGAGATGIAMMNR